MDEDKKDLHWLKEQLAKKERTEDELKNLCERKRSLEEKVNELEQLKIEEEKDVTRLEGGTLSSFFYQVIGKKEEKLTKEKEEAYQAKQNYETAREELTLLENEISQRKSILRQLSSYKSRYEQLFQEKLQHLRLANHEEIFKLEEQMNALESQKQEVKEALYAGRQVLSTVDSILDSLNHAGGWAEWDTFGGGGLVSDMIKHDHLQIAQEKIGDLKWELKSFKTELADVEIHADIKVTIDDFLKFADYFFDGLFADWAVLDKISESKSEVTNTKDEVMAVLSKLEDQLDGLERKYQGKVAEREIIVLEEKIRY